MSIEKISVESRQELERMIAKEINQVGEDLAVICSSVPVNDKTSLDILCHDSNGQLVILQLGVNEDDVLLLHGIQSLDYVDKFKSFLKATYDKHKIDDKEKPRLILIAPSFSEALRYAVESMKGMRIDLYEWEYLKIGDQKGLRLQPIFTLESTKTPQEKKHEPKPPPKKKEPMTQPPSPPENREEPKPEPLKEETPKFEPPSEEELKAEKEEPPKRKLKLF